MKVSDELSNFSLDVILVGALRDLRGDDFLCSANEFTDSFSQNGDLPHLPHVTAINGR